MQMEKTRQHLQLGKIGVLHGAKAYLLQDKEGQVYDTESVSAGLDYASVGPEHCFLKDTRKSGIFRRTR